MPFLNNNDKPSFLNKSNAYTPHDMKAFSKPKPQFGKEKNPHQETSVSRYELELSLKRDSKIRRDLAKELGLPIWSKEMNKEVEDIIRREIPQVFGSHVDKREAESWKRKEYSEHRQVVSEKAEGGFTAGEIKAIKRDDAKTKFLERIFRLDKK